MAFLRVREATCTVCGIQFRSVTGDLYVDEAIVCDACIAALWPGAEGSIRDRFSERLASVRPPRSARPWSGPCCPACGPMPTAGPVQRIWLNTAS